MSVRRIKNHGKWVWQARVAFQGLRRAAFRPSRGEARQAEAELLRALNVQVVQADTSACISSKGVILLPQATAGARPVILTDAARKILRGQLEGHTGDMLFPRPDGRPYSREQIGKVFRRAARSAGLKDFHFHDLRHHGATMALNRKFTAPIGWKTERMMRRYAAVTDSTLRAAAEAVSGSEVAVPQVTARTAALES